MNEVSTRRALSIYYIFKLIRNLKNESEFGIGSGGCVLVAG